MWIGSEARPLPELLYHSHDRENGGVPIGADRDHTPSSILLETTPDFGFDWGHASKPMHSLDPTGWYAVLNGFVFLWPHRDRTKRQCAACGARPQVVPTFDAEALLDHFESDTFVSPINSGNARASRPAAGSTRCFPSCGGGGMAGRRGSIRGRRPNFCSAARVQSKRPS